MLPEDRQALLLQMIEAREVTQEEAALLFGVTLWYVRKLVMAHKIKKVEIPALSPTDQALLQVARATGMDADQLKQALALPPLTDRNIFFWLTQQTPERLARMLFQVVLTQEAHKQEPANATTQAS